MFAVVVAHQKVGPMKRGASVGGFVIDADLLWLGVFGKRLDLARFTVGPIPLGR